MSSHSSRFQRTRRDFLRRAGTCAALPWIVPASVFGADGAVAPSNRITLGFLGVGCMGQGHLAGFLQHPDVQTIAVCDVDRWRRENALRTVEKAYAASKPGGGSQSCTAYVDFREMFARDDLDAVLIALGERWHGTAVAMAARAGKDVYVEKPIALTVAEGRAAVDAVRRYGRVCQVGLQQRSGLEFQNACRLVREGALGKIQRIYTIFNDPSVEVDLPAEPTPESLEWDLWLGPSPWRPFHQRFHYLGRPLNVVPWAFCRDFGGGGIASGGVHAFDVVQWGLGMDHSGPVAIYPPECGKYPDLTYQYADGTLLHVVSGRLDRKRHEIPKGWDPITSIQPFGAVFVGERGWIHVGRQGYLESYPRALTDEYRGRCSPIREHYSSWLRAIRTRGRPTCDIAVGCQSTHLSNLGCIARWTRRALAWDPVREQFAGDDEANRMLRRALREPWQA